MVKSVSLVTRITRSRRTPKLMEQRNVVIGLGIDDRTGRNRGARSLHARPPIRAPDHVTDVYQLLRAEVIPQDAIRRERKKHQGIRPAVRFSR